MTRSLFFSGTLYLYLAALVALASCASNQCSNCGTPGPVGSSGAGASGSTEGAAGARDSGRPDLFRAQGVGHVVYNLVNKHAYIIEAKKGAKPVDLTEAMAKFGPAEGDTPVSISRDGKFLLFSTERFHKECKGWACLSVVPIDLSKGEAILSNGKVVRAEDQAAIASGGNLVVYTDKGSKNLRDIWMTRRIEGNSWSKPVNVTNGSPYNWNENPKLSYDGSKVVLNCGVFNGKDISICEVGVEGKGFRVVATPAMGPHGAPKSAQLRHPDYLPDGSIIFESDWTGEKIWRMPPGAKQPVLASTQFTSDNSPCGLPSGFIASLWLHRPGGKGYHELKIMNVDGSEFFVLTPDVDVYDSAIYCSN